MLSDAELVGQVRRGDVEAFGQLSQRYERSLLALALGNSRDIHSAEDVVQATLLLAFHRLETLRDAEKFGPWLMQIARRQLVEAVRAERIPAGISLHSLADSKGNDTQSQAWIENEHLLSLVARLPEHEGLLVGLRYFDGHSMAEIAEFVARPLGTVTKQLSRAIARLRTWCEKEITR